MGLKPEPRKGRQDEDQVPIVVLLRLRHEMTRGWPRNHAINVGNDQMLVTSEIRSALDPGAPRSSLLMRCAMHSATLINCKERGI